MIANPITSPEFLAGGGEMGERLRAFHWHNTSLGNPAQWPQSLKTCVRIMLSSQQPIWIGWGKELVKLYNDAYIDIVRGKHPVALGQPASVVWKDIWKDIEPLLTRAMQHDQGTYVESQLLIMERSGFPEETYYTFSYTPVLGDDGKPAGIICYNTADTERIINERSLKTLQDLDTLAENKTELEVYKSAIRSIEKNDRDFPFALIHRIAPDAPPEHVAGFPLELKEDIAVALAENRICITQVNQRWQNLPRGPWDSMPDQLLHVPLHGANNDVPLAVLTVGLNPYRKVDLAYRNFIQLIADQISLSVNNALAYELERKRAAELEALDKAKTLFFTNISHEFRTPITLMLGPLEEMINTTTAIVGEEEKEKLALTHRNAMRLLKLVNTLLDFSRIESGRQKAALVPTDISSFTKRIASSFQPLVEKAGLRFTINVQPVPQPVPLDRDMWEKIVFNLLSNAFKYTLRGGITVSLAAQGDIATLTVEDTGVGIPPAELPHMFDRFHRVENSAGRTHEGTGIGLSLTRELVLLHKGDISVESGVNKGSRFTVRIPMAQDATTELLSEPPAKELSYDSVADLYLDEASFLLNNNGTYRKEVTAVPETQDQALTILVVDDNADMRQYLSVIVGRAYNVKLATNGRDALQQVLEQPPDLILSDIMMPVMDGIEMLTKLKKDPSTAHIPVLLITARAGEESKMEGYETGADDYLVKPFSSKELHARIKAQLKIAKVRNHALLQMQHLFQQAPTAIQILRGPSFVYELANDQSLLLLGKKAEQVIGRPVVEVFPEMVEQGFVSLLENVYNSGEQYVAAETPINYHTPAGIIRTFQRFVYAPLRDENGNVTGIMVTGDDITAQVMARKAIEEAERKWRNLLLQAPGIFVVLRGRDMVIDFVNPPLLLSWNKTMDLLGKKLFEALPELQGQPMEHLLTRVYETGEVYHGKEEKIAIIKNGLLEEVYYDYVCQPLLDERGMIEGITMMATDITLQVNARKKIEHTAQQLRTLTETLPQLIWMTDGNGHQEFVSGKWYEYSGIVPVDYQSWVAMIHPDDLAPCAEAWQTSLQTGASYITEARLKNKYGNYRWHHGQGDPIHDEHGQIIFWIGSWTDIHDHKKLNEALQLRDEKKDDFIMMASHELKTPVTTIKGYIQLLQKLYESGDSDSAASATILQTALGSMDKQVNSLSSLITELLNLSKIDKGQFELDKSHFNLADFIKDIVQNAQLTTGHQLRLNCQFNCTLYADKNRIEQVLLNFITNAVKYSPGAAAVDISVLLYGNDLVGVSVQDYGIGMEQKDLDKIFDRFYRVEGRKEKTFPGFGIGLFIAKDIITRHGGKIVVNSEKNKGSTFTFILHCEQVA
ncbi:MAG TPA: ATP-binding protein [Chitinophagaceae bacterium]|nr:ATP-binding protein [Chitinophagaceae bacterium]